MAKLNDIKAAVELLDAADDALWNEDGTPKLEAVQAALEDKKVTAADVAKAIGEYRRPKAADPTPVTDAAAAEPEPASEPESPTDRLMAQVVAARARRDELGAQMREQEDIKHAANRRYLELRALQDKEIEFIEANEPQISHAEAVKRIQAQTVARLHQQREATVAMGAVIAQTGMGVFPSKLDQSLALRKRTQEQQANYAKYVHQNAARAF